MQIVFEIPEKLFYWCCFYLLTCDLHFARDTHNFSPIANLTFHTKSYKVLIKNSGWICWKQYAPTNIGLKNMNDS